MRICLIFLTLLVVAPMATAQFVHPPAYATTEGTGDNYWPFRYTNNAGHYQQAYDATQFPAGPITITRLAFRTKSDSAKVAATADFKMYLSYCANPWNALSSTFANNVGAGSTVVWDGIWNIPAWPGDPGVPNPFYAVLTLMTPFTYDPKLGDLLMDVEMRQSAYPTTAGAFEYCGTSTGISRIYANTGNPLEPSGTVGSYGLITEFNGGGCPTASWTNYDKGYPGTLGVPGLTLSANPILGTTPTMLFTSSSPGNETSLLLYGLKKASIPGFWGGNLLVAPIGVAVLPAPPPGYKIAIPIPKNNALCGVAVYMQVVQSDKGAKMGASSTAGLEMIIGT